MTQSDRERPDEGYEDSQWESIARFAEGSSDPAKPAVAPELRDLRPTHANDPVNAARLALGRALAPLEPWGEWGATFDDDDPPGNPS